MHTHVFYVFMAYPIFLFFGYISRVRGSSWVFFNLSQISEVFSNIFVKNTHIYWRRQWQPTPVLLPGKSHGRRNLVGCSPWGCKESDMTERLHFHFSLSCTGEGNGNPLQCSCLENPRDGKPGGLPSLCSHRVGHDWSDLAAAAHIYRPMLFKSGLFKVSYTWTLG